MSDRKNAREKAQEQLDKYERKVASLTKRHEKALADASRLEDELNEAKAERDYAATHPALKEEAPTLDVAVGSDGDEDES